MLQVCVCYSQSRWSPAGHPASLSPRERAQSSQTNLQVGPIPHHTLTTTHRDSEATTLPVTTSRTYLLLLLLLGEQRLDTHKRLAHLPHCTQDSNPGPLSCGMSILTTTLRGGCKCNANNIRCSQAVSHPSKY